MDILIEKLFGMVPMATMNFLLNVVVLAILFYGIRPWLIKLHEQVKVTNGNVIGLKQWREDHNESDDDRHQENLARFDQINETLRDLNNHSRHGK